MGAGQYLASWRLEAECRATFAVAHLHDAALKRLAIRGERFSSNAEARHYLEVMGSLPLRVSRSVQSPAQIEGGGSIEASFLCVAEALARLKWCRSSEKDGASRGIHANLVANGTVPSVLQSYEELLQRSRLPEIDEYDVILLLRLSTAFDAVQASAACRLCLRRSRPGERYCNEHSRSKLVEGSAAEKMRRYRSGARDSTLEPGNDQQAAAGEYSLTSTIARMLWQWPLRKSKAIDASIRRQLAASPALIQMVGADYEMLDARRLELRLIACIDPFETELTAWPLKLRAIAAGLE